MYKLPDFGQKLIFFIWELNSYNYFENTIHEIL